MKQRFLGRLVAAMLLAGSAVAAAAEPKPLLPADVFGLELAADPQISPDGRQIAYVRQSFDLMTDKARRNLWILDAVSGEHRPIASGTASYSSPRWSPDGRRLAYVSAVDGGAQIHLRWMDSGATARLTDLTAAPQGISWSPDGRQIAFTMFVADEAEPFAKVPSPPKDATWAPKPKVINRMKYRADGEGYLEQGFDHVFVVPADGGSARQVTNGHFNHGGPIAWSPAGDTLYVAANRNENWEYDPVESEIFAIDVQSGAAQALTQRKGPDAEPAVSPDGKLIAYTGFDDRLQSYQNTLLYVMNRDGSGRRQLAADLDESVSNPVWRSDGRAVYFLYDERGVTRLGLATLDGKFRSLASDLGGEDLGRPYSGASFSVARSGAVAFNVTAPEHPADVAVLFGGKVRRLTRLNDDLFAGKMLGAVEAFTVESTGGARIAAWLIKPPGFDANKKYPLILEIHGGPFTNYGPRFTTEMQLYAAAGYVVVYVNPRGSTSYGEAFANHIHHAYPGDDYDDLMAAVDAAIARGFIDADNLFVTGGSGGGILTAWIVGKTNRFRAAVVAKPVINWTSFALTSDGPAFFARYWFGEMPWTAPDAYWQRSPLSLVANVSTPTMLLTGEQDYRTPISESEQYYTALKLRGIDTALVRFPEASHGLVDRPSNLIAKPEYILAWFEKHRSDRPKEPLK